jgi:hypothetical protein
MGQAVSAAAHTAKAQAKADGAKVGPAVSAAVHEAQRAARDREAEAENRETGTISTTSGNRTTAGPGTATSTRPAARP